MAGGTPKVAIGSGFQLEENRFVFEDSFICQILIEDAGSVSRALGAQSSEHDELPRRQLVKIGIICDFPVLQCAT